MDDAPTNAPADVLTAALCRVTNLNSIQAAGLDQLAAMSPAELEAFAAAVDAAWEANRQAVTEAHTAVAAAMTERLAVETAVAAACRNERRVFPTDDESTRCWEAREVWLATKAALDETRERFKAGVTTGQITDQLAAQAAGG